MVKAHYNEKKTHFLYKSYQGDIGSLKRMKADIEAL